MCKIRLFAISSSRFIAMAMLTLTVGLSQPAAIQVDSSVPTDSRIQLREQSDEGSYRFLSIVMVARNGKVSLVTVKDNEKKQTQMPLEVYESLWRFLLEREIESIGNAPLENAFPGQSTFEFSFRNGETEHAFTAYGVDFLTDKRYREIAREIIRIDEQHQSPPVEGPK